MIAKGGKIPTDLTLMRMEADGPAPVNLANLFGTGKVVMFSLPGAFTPTCSARHLPGFVTLADQIKAKGVKEIVCLSVNDVFVMGAWGAAQNVGGHVLMLADGSGLFTKALDAELDLIDKGMGVRACRFALIVEDGVVTDVMQEAPGAFDISSAEAILDRL
jgi:peroxiredoxin (alkyl hydroperoxide reductase subunit C)